MQIKENNNNVYSVHMSVFILHWFYWSSIDWII